MRSFFVNGISTFAIAILSLCLVFQIDNQRSEAAFEVAVPAGICEKHFFFWVWKGCDHSAPWCPVPVAICGVFPAAPAVPTTCSCQ